MPVRAVIFDFGGVISNMRWDVAQELEQEHGLERGVLIRSLYDSDGWRAVEIGQGDIEQWRQDAHARMEQAAGRSLPPLHQQWRDSWRIIDENVALIAALRPAYRTSILSNADHLLEDRLRDGLGLRHLFDDVISSGVVGVAKPDHAIYHMAAERLRLETAECVFIDDTERNVTAAQEVGMQAVHYRVDRGHKLAEQLAEIGVGPAVAI